MTGTARNATITRTRVKHERRDVDPPVMVDGVGEVSRAAARGPSRARHRGAADRSARTEAAKAALGALAVVAAALVLGVIGAVFSATTSGPPAVYSAGQLTAYVPTSVSASRTAATTCLVSWTPASGLPSGLTYDVTDGTGATVATNVSGTSASVTVPAAAVTPTVKARLGNWVSTNATAAATACAGYPDAPTGVTVTPSDAQVAVSWPAPAANGGTLASYAVTGTPSDGTLGTATCTSTAPTTTCTLTGLTNGGTYAVTVTATSNVGTGPASTPVTAIPYPATIMSGPNLRLWLDGADAATMYASSTCTGAAATTTVGCWKDKSVTADDATQTSAGSRPALATVTGRSVPSFDGTTSYLSLAPALLPTGTTASTTLVALRMTDATPASSGFRTAVSWGAGATGQTRSYQKLSGSAQVGPVTWSGSGSSGGSLTTGVTAVLSDAWTSSGFTGYLNGAAGTPVAWSGTTGSTAATIGAQINGTDFWMGPLPEVVVLSGTVSTTDRRTVEEYLARKWGVVITPRAPTAVGATGGQNAQAPVSWTAPVWNGGATVTSYTVTASPGGQTCTTTAPATTCTVTGLTNGTAYTFTVRATNSVGAGPASAASAAVTPYTVPGAPTSVAAAAGDASAAVSWTSPASNGGNAITSYTATAVPSDGTLSTQTCSAASSPCTVTGLTNGITYTVTVTATNAAGAGSASSSTTVTPYPAGVMTAAATSLWLDGADTSTLYTSTACTGAAPSGGGAIGCWKDKSAQANNAVQTTAAYQPTVGSLNSRNAPLFDGSNDYYPLTVAKLPTGTTSSAVYAVAAQEDTSPGSSDFRHVIGWGAAGTGQGRVLEKGSFNSKVYLETYATWPSATVTKNWPVSTAVLTDGVITSTSVTSTMNASPSYSFSATNNTGTSAGAAVGATGWNTSGVWKGRIAEVVVLASNPTAAENRQVQEYLARKWGLTIAPGLVSGVTATASTTTDAAVNVAWTAPTWNGGASISSYTVTATPSDGTLSTVTTSCASSPCTVTGLVNGATYTVTVAPVNSAGTGVATAAAATVYSYPAAVMTTARLRAWLDGADAATMYASNSCSGAAATTTVGCWADKSGQANNAPQSTSGYRPTLTTVNGRSVPGFDGVDDYLPLTVSKLPTGTTSSTMAMTAKLTGTVGYRNLMSWGALTGGQARATYLNTGPVISDTYTAGPTASTSPTNIVQNQQFQLTSAYTSGSSSIALNGVGATTVAGAVSTGSTFALLGAPPA